MEAVLAVRDIAAVGASLWHPPVGIRFTARVRIVGVEARSLTALTGSVGLAHNRMVPEQVVVPVTLGRRPLAHRI